MVYYVDERTARILVRSAGAQRCCDHVCLHIIHSVCCVSLCLCVCLRTSSITSTRTNITTFLYTISHKNHASLFLSITLAYLERFFTIFVPVETAMNTLQLLRSTQPSIPPGSLNRVPASAGGKGGKVTSAGWQVTPCDLIWHVISRSGVVISITNCYIRFTLLLLYLLNGLMTSYLRQIACHESLLHIDYSYFLKLNMLNSEDKILIRNL